MIISKHNFKQPIINNLQNDLCTVIVQIKNVNQKFYVGTKLTQSNNNQI